MAAGCSQQIYKVTCAIQNGKLQGLISCQSENFKRKLVGVTGVVVVLWWGD